MSYRHEIVGILFIGAPCSVHSCVYIVDVPLKLFIRHVTFMIPGMHIRFYMHKRSYLCSVLARDVLFFPVILYTVLFHSNSRQGRVKGRPQ